MTQRTEDFLLFIFQGLKINLYTALYQLQGKWAKKLGVVYSGNFCCLEKETTPMVTSQCKFMHSQCSQGLYFNHFTFSNSS